MVALAIGMIITITLPAAIVYLIHRRSRVPVAVPLIAAIFYVFGVALSVPLTAWIWPLIFGSRRALGAVLLSAGTVAVCQEFVRFLAFRYIKTMQRHRDHAGALAAGIGQAGLASILSGLQLLGGVTVMALFPTKFDPAQVQQALVHGAPIILLQSLSQLPMMALSLAYSVLVVLAFRRNWLFLAVAVVAHAGILCLVGVLANYFWSLAVLSLFGGLALIFVFLVIRSRIIAPPPETHEPEPVDRPARIF